MNRLPPLGLGALVSLWFAVLAALTSSSVLAQDARSTEPIRDRWSVVDAQPVGTPLVVVMKNSSRRTCKFSSSDARALRLSCAKRDDTAVPKADVERVERPERGSRTGLWALLGGTGGFALGAGNRTYEGPLANRGWNAIVAGGAGAVLGAVLGHAHGKPPAAEPLYRAR